VAAPKTSNVSGIPAVTTTTTLTITTQQPVETAPPFDYQAEIKRITHEIETKLKAKLEAAIANLQASVESLEQCFEQKLNLQIESLKATQADKTTQDNHSRDLEELTKNS